MSPPVASMREITESLYGAWRLMRFDVAGFGHFKADVGAFWRSFTAALLVLPFYGLLLALRLSADGLAMHPIRYLTVEAIGYVIAWLIFPFAMVYITKLLDCEDRFVGYIVAYNWAAVLQNAVYLPLGFLVLAGILPLGAGEALGLTALTWIMVFSWFIARHALGLTPITAAGIVILDFLLGLLVNSVTQVVQGVSS